MSESQDVWKDITGNDYIEIELKEKTENYLKKLEEHKQEILQEERKYKEMWDKLDRETKLEINRKANEIARERPFPTLEMTKRLIKCELMDKMKEK